MKLIFPVDDTEFACESGGCDWTNETAPGGLYTSPSPDRMEIAADDIPNTTRPQTPCTLAAQHCSKHPQWTPGESSATFSCNCNKPRADGLRKAERAARPAPRGVLKPADGAESTKKSVRFSEQLECVMPDWSPPVVDSCAVCSPVRGITGLGEDGKRPLEDDFSWLAVFSAGGSWVAESTLKLASPIAQGAWDWFASSGGVSAGSGSPKRRKHVSWAVWSGGVL